MSDGQSDGLRAWEEANHAEAFYIRFILALKEKCVTRADVITKLVHDADEGRVFGRHAENLKKIQEIAAALKAKDERAWAKFITRAEANVSNPEHIRTLISVSPFKKMVPMRLKYGYGFVSLGGDRREGGAVEMVLADRLRKEGKATYQADGYLVLIPKEVLDKAKIIWVEGPEATPVLADRPKKAQQAA